ncbi:MAG TPA: hypothetical protein PLC53_03275 [Bacilli bacterium]|nr:hypothetical protein [Bacilli bacterium]
MTLKEFEELYNKAKETRLDKRLVLVRITSCSLRVAHDIIINPYIPFNKVIEILKLREDWNTIKNNIRRYKLNDYLLNYK